MKFDFQNGPTLPALAWSARMRKGSDTVKVFHGHQIETTAESFIEGAWDAPYEEGQFHRARTLSGSGARLLDDGVMFCAPTDGFDRILVSGDDSTFWASNSLAFLLVQIEDRLDIRHPWYLYDLLQAKRWGLRKKEKFIVTAGGRRVFIYDYCNLLVNSRLERQRFEKPLYPVPDCFTDYLDLLQGAVDRLVENANHPARRTRYPPITSISEGYDSTAVSVLAARAGCKEAFTFETPEPEPPQTRDSGAANVRLLGLEVKVYSRFACHDLPGLPEAEFQAGCPDATGMVIAAAERQLQRKLCFQGHGGEDVWETNLRYALPDMLNPDSITLWPAGECEFRLRVGYLRISVPFIACQHREAIESISRSAEMQPWSLPERRYNRPIARRIAEEAGIPRGAFANRRQGGAYSRQPWKAESWSDFMAFIEAAGIPRYFRWGWMLPSDFLALPLDVLYALQKKYRSILGFRLLLPLFMLSKRSSIDHRRRSLRLYSAHWGIEKIKFRYECRE